MGDDCVIPTYRPVQLEQRLPFCFKFQSGSADGMQGTESREFGGGVNERIGGGRARSHFLSRVPQVPLGSSTGDRGSKVRQAQN